MNEDEAWVSKRYQKAMHMHQESENPLSPSASIDEAILAKAKQASQKPNITAQEDSQKKPRSWLRWQYGGSVAASVLILVFVYIGQYQNVPEQAELSVPASTPENLSSFMDDQEEVHAPSPIQSSNSTSQPIELVAKDMEAPSTLSLAAQAKAIFVQMQSIKQADEAAARSELAMQSRAKKESQKRLLEKEKSSLKENAVKPDGYTELQVELFKTLQQQKLSEKDWRLPEQYKAGLTEKQIATLLKKE
jgi:hypothetical protein